MTTSDLNLGWEPKTPAQTVNNDVIWELEEGDEIISSNFSLTIPAGLTIDTSSYTGFTTTVQLSGGVSGQTGMVTNQIVVTRFATGENETLVQTIAQPVISATTGLTSGSYTFNPSIGELTLYAFGLIGIRRTAILQEHLQDARMAVNLMLAEWGNDTPNLWTVDLVVESLVQGQATVAVDPNTIMVLDAYLRSGEGEAINDRIITPISRTEYASMPNKLTEAPPTSFWFDRLISPTITLWPVPDENGPYELRYYRCTQIQDAFAPNGQVPAIPQRWLPAFAWGLAAQLAPSYAPDRAVAMDGRAERTLSKAREQDQENVPMFIQPGLGNYYPR